MTGLVVAFIGGGGLVLALAIFVTFYVLSSRRKSTGSARDLAGSNPEIAAAQAKMQADIEKGQRGF